MSSIPQNTKEAFEESAKYFPTTMQSFMFYDKYSRYNYDLMRRETWVESVDRVIKYFKKLSGNKLTEEEYEEIREGIITMQVMPAMRVLAMGGEAAERQSLCQYNCSYLTIDCIDAWVEALIISFSGCGVGFSVENKNVNKLPIVKKQIGLNGSTPTHVVSDDTQGWADALRLGLEAWYEGKDVKFDYSQIREAGAVLKVKGGRASGSEPLEKLLDFIKETLLNAQERRLTSLECHDIMCQVGDCAVSGGQRRTAMISLFDQDDEEMLNCKNGDLVGKERRWNSNNSAVWTETTTDEDIVNQMISMFEGMRGEPGIFSRVSAKKSIPAWRKQAEFGSNPCLAPDTLVQTKQGHFQIQDLVGKIVDIWDGNDWVSIDNFRITAENKPMLKIILQDGSEIRSTEYHEFILQDGRRVEAKDLRAGHKLAISTTPESHGNIKIKGAYIKGFLLGDGTHTEDRPILWLYDTKYGCEERLIKSASEVEKGEVYNNVSIEELNFVKAGDNRKVLKGLSIRKSDLFKWTTDYKKRLPKEVFEWDKESKTEFLAGIFDSDGTASDTKNGWLYQITSINREFLLDLQSLLKTTGVFSRLSLGHRAGKRDFNDGYGEYDMKESWRLTLGQEAAIKLAQQISFSRLVSFADKKTSYFLQPRWNKIVSIEADGVEEKVYCCTVNTTHSFSLTDGLQIAQCCEILLRPNELCNLSIVVARSDDNLETLKQKVRLATIIGTLQAQAVNFPGLRPIWEKNAREEALLGVDITGQTDCPYLLNNADIAFPILRELAVEVNREYAKKLDINPSAAITCNKPSGNSSTLLDCSSGIHARHAPYYIRRVRVSAKSPIFSVLKDSGVTMRPENEQNEKDAITWVVSFPIKAPDGAITKKDRNALAQLEWWKKNKTLWTHHNPSCTIGYKEDEREDILKWILKNKDIINGLSFLPETDARYDQMPYEEITQAQYEKLINEFPVIDWSLLWLYEYSDMTEAAKEIACVNGACDLSDHYALQSTVQVIP